MDRQNRVGSKFGGGGISSAAQTERERKERLKQLALESIDLAKDPYFVRNHLGSYECKLCCTVHRDEANYLAHTQGKKHQQGLARRAHQEKLVAEQQGAATTTATTNLSNRSTIGQQQQQQRPQQLRIGRPAYQVYKSPVPPPPPPPPLPPTGSNNNNNFVSAVRPIRSTKVVISIPINAVYRLIYSIPKLSTASNINHAIVSCRPTSNKSMYHRTVPINIYY
jgi:hypothetical protein